MQSEITVKVTGEAPYWYDSNLANAEPNCQIYAFECKASERPSIQRVQFGFCYRDFAEQPEEVAGFDQLQRFRSTQTGDSLVLTITDPGRDVVVLSTIRGHLEGRGQTLYPDNDKSAEILRIRNTTQGWEIPEAPGSDPNMY